MNAVDHHELWSRIFVVSDPARVLVSKAAFLTSTRARALTCLHRGDPSVCFTRVSSRLQAKHFKLMCMALRVTACLIPVSHPSSPRSPATSIAEMCLSRIDASSPKCACPGSTRPRRNVPVLDRRVLAEMCLSRIDASARKCACPRINASSPRCACPRSTRPRRNVPVRGQRVLAEMCLSQIDASSPKCACPGSLTHAHLDTLDSLATIRSSSPEDSTL